MKDVDQTSVNSSSQSDGSPHKDQAGAKAPPFAPAQPTSTRNKLLAAAAGLGLLLLGLGIGLAIGLPLAFRNKGSSNGNAVQLTGDGDSSLQNLKGATRTYYLAADPVVWDYAPAGKNLCTGKPFEGDAELYTTQGIGTKYKKALYRQYTDDSFEVGVMVWR